MRVAGPPHREARPERVAQRAARQRKAERVVLVHHVGDEVEAGVESIPWTYSGAAGRPISMLNIQFNHLGPFSISRF